MDSCGKDFLPKSMAMGVLSYLRSLDIMVISAFHILSYMVGVVEHLGEHCNFFRLRRERSQYKNS